MKYVVAALALIILGFIGIMIFGKDEVSLMTEPVRQEFASRQSRGIKDSFHINKTTVQKDSGTALLSVTHENGTVEDRLFSLVKKNNVWQIGADEAYTPPAPRAQAGATLPKILKIEYLDGGKKAPDLDSDGVPIYTFNTWTMNTHIIFDRPITTEFTMYQTERFQGRVSTSRKVIKPENPPTADNWSYFGSEFIIGESRLKHVGDYTDIFKIGDETYEGQYRVK